MVMGHLIHFYVLQIAKISIPLSDRRKSRKNYKCVQPFWKVGVRVNLQKTECGTLLNFQFSFFSDFK